MTAGQEAAQEDGEEAARRLFAGPIRFELGAPRLDILPPADLPEVAFAGRSNVGKSSLLNALTGRTGLARTSNTPGRTQELNLFLVGDPPVLRLVDMPGYGYAEAPQDVVARWTRLVGRYLSGRPSLRRVLLLIDSRHGLKPADREVMAALDRAAVSYQLVLTKADKVKNPETVREMVAEDARRHPAAHPHVLVTSSAKGLGTAELRAAVRGAALGETSPQGPPDSSA